MEDNLCSWVVRGKDAVGCWWSTYHLCHPLDWHVLVREQFAFSGKGNKNMATHWQPLVRIKRPNGKNGICLFSWFGTGFKRYCVPNATYPPRIENVFLSLKIGTRAKGSMLTSELRFTPWLTAPPLLTLPTRRMGCSPGLNPGCISERLDSFQKS